MKRFILTISLTFCLIGCMKPSIEVIENTPTPIATETLLTIHHVDEDGISFSYSGNNEPIIKDGKIIIYLNHLNEVPYIEISKSHEETLSFILELDREYVIQPTESFVYEVGKDTYLGSLSSFKEGENILNELYLEKEKNGSYIQIKATFMDENDEKTFKMIQEITENLTF
ncbi:MAG: hypothetical protein IKE51_02785 [Solobacterium sp.]|nr:hypothetical protein [Solobacterium sp.]